jgi:hypothetical protein
MAFKSMVHSNLLFGQGPDRPMEQVTVLEQVNGTAVQIKHVYWLLHNWERFQFSGNVIGQFFYSFVSVFVMLARMRIDNYAA